MDQFLLFTNDLTKSHSRLFSLYKIELDDGLFCLNVVSRYVLCHEQTNLLVLTLESVSVDLCQIHEYLEKFVWFPPTHNLSLHALELLKLHFWWTISLPLPLTILIILTLLIIYHY